MDPKFTCPKLPWMIDFHSNEKGDVLNTQYQAAFANTTLEYLSGLNVNSKPSIFRSTQLICSIQSSFTCAKLEDMLSSGMSVARITGNKLEKIQEVISKVRSVNDSYNRKLGRIYPLAIALDVKGPEIRTGILKNSNKKVFLEKGQITNITTKASYEDFVTEDMIFVDYEKLPEVVQPGDRVILDNGTVTLSAIECAESIIKCIVEKAGLLLSNASVIVPNAPIDLPRISASDKGLLELAIGECIDFLFISGIYNKDGVTEIKELLGQSGETIQVISRIETYTAIDNIDEIIKASDGILIDCDRLMIELPKEKVFLVQKSVLAKCNLAGKPVVSTIQIADLRSVSKSEVSDIANAIIDGSDALLLPHEACTKELMKAISNICKEAEPAVYQRQVFSELTNGIPAPMEPVYSLAISAVESALKSNAAAIICLTSSGRTAKVLARFRPRCPIIAITRYARVARLLGVFKGVEVLVYLKILNGSWVKDVEERIQLGVTYGKYVGYIRKGDAVVAVTSSRPESGLANTLKLIYASDFDAIPKKSGQDI